MVVQIIHSELRLGQEFIEGEVERTRWCLQELKLGFLIRLYEVGAPHFHLIAQTDVPEDAQSHPIVVIVVVDRPFAEEDGFYRGPFVNGEAVSPVGVEYSRIPV